MLVIAELDLQFLDLLGAGGAGETVRIHYIQLGIGFHW